MTDTPPGGERPPEKTIQLVVDNAAPVRKRKPKPKPEEGAPFYAEGLPDCLPPDSPVIALGRKGNICYFLDSIGQLIALKCSEVNRLNIIGLFGGEQWLRKRFPVYDKDGNLKNWNHGILGGMLIRACTEKGVWDPMQNVREQGGWVEDSGDLITHCGDVLYIGKERCGTGLRGKLLYPKCTAMREPVFGAKQGPDGPAARLLKLAETWHWAEPMGARLWVGLYGCQCLGQANEWRAQGWLTGGFGTGKTTLQLLGRWLHGKDGIIQAENATPAGVSQTVGYSSRPVSLDELEAKADNRQVNETVELMRIASSGGTRLRGGQDGAPSATQLWNSFIASSVLVPPLRAQDRSRIAMLVLLRRETRGREPGEDDVRPEEEDIEAHAVLGKRSEWERAGAELRGRLIEQWPRYKRTFHGYRRGLLNAGHTDRGADQYAAIGAAYDLMMWDGFDPARAEEWGQAIPPSVVGEADQKSEERQCLDHLLEYLPDHFRGGARESVAYWLIEARRELLEGAGGKDARETLARLGLRVYRDASSYQAGASKRFEGARDYEDQYAWFVDVSHTSLELRKVYQGTQWKGEAGAAGTWAQALQRLEGAITAKRGDKRRRRIGGVLHHVTTLPWDTVFPPFEAGEEDDIAPPDRGPKA